MQYMGFQRRQIVLLSYSDKYFPGDCKKQYLLHCTLWCTVEWVKGVEGKREEEAEVEQLCIYL